MAWHCIACMPAHFKSKSFHLHCSTAGGCETDRVLHGLHDASYTVPLLRLVSWGFHLKCTKSDVTISVRRGGQTEWLPIQPHCRVEWLNIFILWLKKRCSGYPSIRHGVACILENSASNCRYDRQYNHLLLHHITTRCVFKFLSIYNHPFFSSSTNFSWNRGVLCALFNLNHPSQSFDKKIWVFIFKFEIPQNEEWWNK